MKIPEAGVGWSQDEKNAYVLAGEIFTWVEKMEQVYTELPIYDTAFTELAVNKLRRLANLIEKKGRENHTPYRPSLEELLRD